MAAGSERARSMSRSRTSVVVIGGSAGSLEAMCNLVSALPADLPAAVFVVVHVLPVAESRLPQILDRRGPLSARHARNGDPIEPGQILVAPPDQHLLIRGDHVELNRGPRENSTRPAIDPLFRSAAEAFDGRVCAVVLSGNLDDGSEGIRQVVTAGGIGIVQDPGEALHQEMPCNALARCPTCLVLRAAEIGRAIAELTAGTPLHEVTAAEGSADPFRPRNGRNQIGAEDSPGAPTGLTCPECHGVLWASPDLTDSSLHCRIGHTYSLKTLQAERRQEIEGAMNAAVRALHEESSLARHIADRAETRGRQTMARRFSLRAEAAMGHARVLEDLLAQPVPLPIAAEDAGAIDVQDAS
jgi:two-component system, chemotaxis family, protein-glutamate methylesterase/glutaminase